MGADRGIWAFLQSPSRASHP